MDLRQFAAREANWREANRRETNWRPPLDNGHLFALLRCELTKKKSLGQRLFLWADILAPILIGQEAKDEPLATAKPFLC